jgi:hypothetical protein
MIVHIVHWLLCQLDRISFELCVAQVAGNTTARFGRLYLPREVEAIEAL